MSGQATDAARLVSPRAVVFRLWSGGLPDEVCDAAIAELNDEELVPSHVQMANSGTNVVDPLVRSAKHVFLNTDHWSGSFATHYAHEANRIWGFDFSSLSTLSYVRYEEGDHFAWHVDVLTYEAPLASAPSVQVERKLSVTVNLSDPDDYTGGDLELVDPAGRELQVPEGRARGSVMVFPSTVRHRVTPITSGVRHALVAWMIGPRLR